ncbi:hypothetical protein V8C86DRAFT_2700848 [Haematococcus lacustris]
MSKHDRGHPAFPPVESNIGGAHLILTQYVDLHDKVACASPSRALLLSKQPPPPLSPAQRLSLNRAARRATTDHTTSRHNTRVKHLTQRIESMFSATERRHPPSPHATHRASSAHSPARPSLHESFIQPWAEGHGYSTVLVEGRPMTAPEYGRARRPHQPDTYQGWSVTNSLRHTFRADDFPLNRGLPLRPLAADYDVYKKAIMGDIVARRMYKAVDLRKLFQKYLRGAPLHEKQVVEHVVADIKTELQVS